MSGSRRRAREYAIQLLFQIDLTSSSGRESFRGFWEAHPTPAEVREFAEKLVEGVDRQREELDRWITAFARHWRLERMPAVDRNVLRLGAYEMLNERDTPLVVAIDEAVDLAKKYGTEDSGAFVNGVLDSIRLRIERGELHPPEVSS